MVGATEVFEQRKDSALWVRNLGATEGFLSRGEVDTRGGVDCPLRVESGAWRRGFLKSSEPSRGKSSDMN